MDKNYQRKFPSRFFKRAKGRFQNSFEFKMKNFKYLILQHFRYLILRYLLSIFAYALFLKFAIRPIVDRMKPHTVFRRSGMYFIKNARIARWWTHEKILISSRMGEYCGTQNAEPIRPGRNRPFTSHDPVARFYAETAREDPQGDWRFTSPRARTW